MKLLFVAKSEDKNAVQAINVLEQLTVSEEIKYETEILDGNGPAPVGSIALFTTADNSLLRKRRLRCAAHRLGDIAPQWARNTPFLVALRSPDLPANRKTQKGALKELLASYSDWTPGSNKRCPWSGGEPTSPENQKLFEDWLEKVAEITGTQYVKPIGSYFVSKKAFKRALGPVVKIANPIKEIEVVAKDEMYFADLARSSQPIKMITFLCPIFGQGSLTESKLLADPQSLEEAPPFFTKFEALVAMAKFLTNEISNIELELTVTFADAIVITDERKCVQETLDKHSLLYERLLQERLKGVLKYKYLRFSQCKGLDLPMFIDPRPPTIRSNSMELYCSLRGISFDVLNQWIAQHPLQSIFEQWGHIGVELFAAYDIVGYYFADKIDILLSVERFAQLHSAYQLNNNSPLLKKAIIEITTV